MTYWGQQKKYGQKDTKIWKKYKIKLESLLEVDYKTSAECLEGGKHTHIHTEKLLKVYNLQLIHN